MLVQRRTLACVVAALLASCASSLKITSSTPGARILIDGRDTGYKTPDTFRPRILPSGEHRISVVPQGEEESEAKQISVHASPGLIIGSILFPPALLVNVFKGFSSVAPRLLYFDTRNKVAQRVSPAPAPQAVQPLSGERAHIGQPGTQCAALPLKTMGLSDAVGLVIDELLLTELQQSGFLPIGRDDLDAMLDFDKQKSAADCSDAVCIAEIGNALGVPYLVSGNVAYLEHSLVLTLKLIDVRGTRVVARINHMLEGKEDAVPRLIAEGVRELVTRSAL